MIAEAIAERNLSVAWLRAFQASTRPGIGALAPLVVSVTGFDKQGVPEQTEQVEALIDSALRELHDSKRANRSRSRVPPLTCQAAANTIFPASLWRVDRPRQELFARYGAILPLLRADPRNRRGLYFERLVSYEGAPQDGNQLEHLIDLYQRGVRRLSAYQASISRPGEDLTAMPLQGFPCLQQIAVHPDRRAGTLALTAFYGTQYIFERAYGNYLGLCRLAAFIAHEMNLRLVRMTCVSGHAPRGDISVARGRRLAADAAEAV